MVLIVYPKQCQVHGNLVHAQISKVLDALGQNNNYDCFNSI